MRSQLDSAVYVRSSTIIRNHQNVEACDAFFVVAIVRRMYAYRLVSRSFNHHLIVPFRSSAYALVDCCVSCEFSYRAQLFVSFSVCSNGCCLHSYPKGNSL